jgi:hypothetical protein
MNFVFDIAPETKIKGREVGWQWRDSVGDGITTVDDDMLRRAWDETAIRLGVCPSPVDATSSAYKQKLEGYG